MPRKAQVTFDEAGNTGLSLQDDPELASAVSDYSESLQEWENGPKELATTMRTLKKRIRDLIDNLGLATGKYKVGNFEFEVKALAGGGFEVPAWTGKTFKVKALPVNTSGTPKPAKKSREAQTIADEINQAVDAAQAALSPIEKNAADVAKLEAIADANIFRVGACVWDASKQTGQCEYKTGKIVAVESPCIHVEDDRRKKLTGVPF